MCNLANKKDKPYARYGLSFLVSACGSRYLPAVDQPPCHLSTATFSLRLGHNSALTVHRTVIHYLVAALLPCTLSSSATGGVRVRFPFQKAQKKKHPDKWMLLFLCKNDMILLSASFLAIYSLTLVRYICFANSI